MTITQREEGGGGGVRYRGRCVRKAGDFGANECERLGKKQELGSGIKRERQ